MFTLGYAVHGIKYDLAYDDVCDKSQVVDHTIVDDEKDFAG
jgi:hypothetical protein